MAVAIFEAIKSAADLSDVVRHNGVELDRHGKGLCPFHPEKTPSFSAKGGYWKCFGCGEGGDVIDFIAKLHGLSVIESARMLDSMYKLQLFAEQANTAEIRRRARQAQLESETLTAFDYWIDYATAIWAWWIRTLTRWKIQYAPATPEDEPHECFIFSCAELPKAEAVFNELIDGDYNAKAEHFNQQWHKWDRDVPDERKAFHRAFWAAGVFEARLNFYKQHANLIEILGRYYDEQRKI